MKFVAKMRLFLIPNANIQNYGLARVRAQTGPDFSPSSEHEKVRLASGTIHCRYKKKIEFTWLVL